MVRIVCTLSLLILSACNSRDLNINALDLKPYTRDLSVSQEHFPAYIDLMTPGEGRTGVVPSEVEKIAQFFNQHSEPKQLFLVGQPGIEVDARVYALAKHDKNHRFLEIDLGKLGSDAKAQAWTQSEYEKVLTKILNQNRDERTVFYFADYFDSEVPSVLRNYPSILKTRHDAYVRSDFSGKALRAVKQIPLVEFVDYVKSIEGSDMLAVLCFAFLQGHSLLDASEEIIRAQKSEPDLKLGELVFAHYQTLNKQTVANHDVRLNILATAGLKLDRDILNEIDAKVSNEANYFVELPKFLKTAEALESTSRMFKELSDFLGKIRLVRE